MLAGGRDVDVAVAGREDAGRDRGRMVVARLLGDLALHQPARGLEVEHEDLRLDQRGVNPLALLGALAVIEREDDRLGEQQARGQVGDRNADPHRPAAGLAGDRHQPAHALGDLVDSGPRRIGAGLAEAGDRAVDDLGIDLLHRLVVDLEAVLHVGAVVLDDDVGLLGELHEDRVTFLALEVERDRLLVAMQVLEVEAVARAAHGVGAAGFGGLLDLDDLGAPVGELAHRRRAGAMRGQVEDQEIVQGQRDCRHRPILLSSCLGWCAPHPPGPWRKTASAVFFWAGDSVEYRASRAGNSLFRPASSTSSY